jgi:hypothetical protein
MIATVFAAEDNSGRRLFKFVTLSSFYNAPATYNAFFGAMVQWCNNNV